MKWKIGFETPHPHPQPYYEIEGSADFCMGFMQAVVTKGWTLTTVTPIYERQYHV